MPLPSSTNAGTGASSDPASGTTSGSAGTTSAGTTSSSPLTAGVSPGMMAVLRKIVTDANFRVQFGADPVLAITSAGIPVTTDDMSRLTSLTAAQLDQLAQGVVALSNASAGASGLMAKAEGTNTLIYAVLVAVLLAVRAK